MVFQNAFSDKLQSLCSSDRVVVYHLVDENFLQQPSDPPELFALVVHEVLVFVLSVWIFNVKHVVLNFALGLLDIELVVPLIAVQRTEPHGGNYVLLVFRPSNR